MFTKKKKNKFRPKIKNYFKETKSNLYGESLVQTENIEDLDLSFPVVSMEGKKIVLGGLYSDFYNSEDNQLDRIPHEILDHAIVILEFPQLTGTNKKGFSERDLEELNIQDPTQKALLMEVNKHPTKAYQIIGADGRKAYTQNGSVHDLSVQGEKGYLAQLHNDLITEAKAVQLVEDYLELVLLAESENVRSVADGINKMLTYNNGTDIGLVIGKTAQRVIEVSKYLSLDKRIIIKEVLMQALETELLPLIEDYKEEMTDLSLRRQDYQDMAERKLKELEPYWEIIGKESYNRKAIKIKKEVKYKVKADHLEVESKYKNAILNAMNNAFANVLLLSEVAGADRENVIVTFEENHLEPLKNMIVRFKELGQQK
ncbi:hypothetical protein [Xanthovirga aplysinae]|uniref:hypothetical protein n=1 Tax=Xanthovirga aplysinae TaxID=2529853 RepID=UPI0012BC1766|nr:hypothetical protein [Xanthovirga aplysinae]MTI30584.1 hypothetical protein [Xanthovirga aplysinae]